MNATVRNFDKANKFNLIENFLMGYTRNQARGKKLTYDFLAETFEVNINTLRTWKKDKLANGVTVQQAIVFMNEEIRCPQISKQAKPIMDFYFADAEQEQKETKVININKSEKMENQNQAATSAKNNQVVSTLTIAETLAEIKLIIEKNGKDIDYRKEQLELDITSQANLVEYVKNLELQILEQLVTKVTIQEVIEENNWNVPNNMIDVIKDSIIKEAGNDIGFTMINESDSIPTYERKLIMDKFAPFVALISATN